MDQQETEGQEGVEPAPLPAAAAMLMGVLAVLIVGVAPALFGALVDEHRIGADDLGLVVTLELLCMGITTALAGAFMKAEALKAVAVGSLLCLAAANVATVHADGMAIFAIRTLAGIPEGLLLWITVGMIARSRTPDRWAAIFFTGQVIAQLLMALAYAVVVIPKFGADGGFAALGVVCLLGFPAVTLLPARYGPLVSDSATTGPPPTRGLIALIGTVVFIASNGAVSVYLQPLAHQAGLSSDVARTALWVFLAAQIPGGVLATVLAGRVRWLAVFSAVTVGFLIAWAAYALHPSATVFIAASGLAGLSALMIGPFLVPMTIEADPSRRAAMQSAGAQLFGGALGPLIASRVVSDADVRGVLWFGVVTALAGLAVMAWLHFTHRETAS